MREYQRTHRNCIFAQAAMLLALLMMLPTVALAIAPMDTARTCSLTIQVSAAEQPVQGVQFDLYRAAAASEYAEFTLTEAFESLPIDPDDLKAETAEDWRRLSATLSGYVAAEGFRPDATGLTDENGLISLSGLKSGLYLAVGAQYTVGEKAYTPEAALVALPGRDEADQWIYDVSIQPKQGEPTDAPTRLEVIKVWDDGDYEERPEEVTMLLLCNGRPAEEVRLSRDNNWRYEWTNLEGGKIWQVVEKPVPEDYTVDIDYEGTLVTITNTRDEDDDDPPGGGGNLPQTGLNWWPVWITAGAGMLLFLTGWIRQRMNRE